MDIAVIKIDKKEGLQMMKQRRASLYTKVVKYIICFLGLIIFYIAFLVLGQAIPRRLVVDNALASYNELNSQGLYFKVVDGASWDNLTDSFFINTAVTEYDGNLLEKAIANAYTTMENNGWKSVLEGIMYSVDGDENVIIKPYSRYWVGMVTIYKVLLIFMPISGIRTFIFGITIVLFAMAILNVYKMLGMRGLIPFLTSVILALYIPQAICLVFGIEIIMMLLMMNICYIMIKRNASIDTFCVAFFLAGSILAYLNYWGFPLITLGFPLVFIVTVKLVNKYDMKTLMKEVILVSFSWGAGLAGTILAKQIVSKIVLGEQTGTSRLLERMGSEVSLSDRFVSVFNGLVQQMSSTPVFISIIVVTIVSIVLFKTNGFKRNTKVFLFVFIALYPVAWWFILVSHSELGFVKHMYGVTYYALLSALFIKCKKCASLSENLHNITKKSVIMNISVVVVWFVLLSIFLNTVVHYGTNESEPWSSETIETINLTEKSAVQEVYFNELALGEAYLKSVSTILVNIIDDTKEEILHVEIAENGNVLTMADVSIKDIEIGEYFKIPLGCVIYSGDRYEVSYSLKNVNHIEPYLLIQDDSQAVRENGVLYVDGTDRSGAIINKYEYDDYMLSSKAKIAIMFIVLFILQYMLFLYEGKDKVDFS
ncbi:MAG: hypothetical protein HDR19_00055 [Lachnospiraceae bacterium]|nr:hypothetical protein [Lachnospiraceae bacterium]